MPLSREIFPEPIGYQQVCTAVLRWLNGQKSHFVLPEVFRSSRVISHYFNVLCLADQTRAQLVMPRMRSLLCLHGIAPK